MADQVDDPGVDEQTHVDLGDLIDRQTLHHQTLNTNLDDTDIQAKRRALLALSDWAGLHTQFDLELERGHQNQGPPEQVLGSETSYQLQTHIGADDPSLLDNENLSQSSAEDPIASPTPTNPRVRRPLVRSSSLVVFQHFSPTLDEDGEQVRSEQYDHEDERAEPYPGERIHHDSLPGSPDGADDPISLISGSESAELEQTAERPSESSKPIRQDNQPIQTDRFYSVMPRWICDLSEELGFSPPNKLSDFETRRALEIESQHAQSFSIHGKIGSGKFI